MDRLYTKLGLSDLKQLQKLALEEHENFIERNTHLRKAYYDSLVGIALCQGAASHYINASVGIKDFDIWLFYVENENIRFPYRAYKSIENGYMGRRIDFLKRAIPIGLCVFCSNEPDECIMRYLFERNTKTKRLLLEKAIVGLFPDMLFGKVLWKADL